MHEFSLAERILECALEISRANGGAPVERIGVEIGALQAVVPESLKFAFDAARTDTPAAGAVLDWREVTAMVECPACASAYVPEDMIWMCPSCGATGGRAVRGDDLVVTCVELADVIQTQESTPGS